MVPVGGFLLVILRNIIGISTFGTFMPVLIALAFRETQLLWGIVFFSALVALGLSIRFYLDRLKLLLVPRLAAVLIVVVILIALMSIITNRLGIERGLSVALFPMVILTMTIERMSIVWEERGPLEAIKQGLGSLVAAALAYLVMHHREIQHLFFVFPELLLVLLAGTLLLGRYSGYRLLEILAFQSSGEFSVRGTVMFGLGRRLADLGIMGINRRNAEFTLVHNPRRYYPLVDDKLRTKELAAAASIPVPELYGVVRSEYQVRHLPVWLKDHEDFVIKPAHGSGGEGILVIAGRGRANYRTVGGLLMTLEEVNHHVFNILGGLYSLGGQTDAALIEYRVRFDPVFDHISYQGVPDVRIIIFLGVPVMAMLRLPTRASGGKANLHQGAIGAGIDLATGATLKGVSRQEIVGEHPDTGHSIQGLVIPHWETLLDIAARCQELTGLGYLGVDLVLDQNLGPLLLELNARPGLAIQIANAAGLMHRVKLVQEHIQALPTVPERLAFARQHFGVKQPPVKSSNPEHRS